MNTSLRMLINIVASYVLLQWHFERRKSAIFFNPPWRKVLPKKKPAEKETTTSQSWIGVLCVKFRNDCHQLFRSECFASSSSLFPICWIYDLSFILCRLFLIVHLYNSSDDSSKETKKKKWICKQEKDTKNENRMIESIVISIVFQFNAILISYFIPFCRTTKALGIKGLHFEII